MVRGAVPRLVPPCAFSHREVNVRASVKRLFRGRNLLPEPGAGLPARWRPAPLQLVRGHWTERKPQGPRAAAPQSAGADDDGLGRCLKLHERELQRRRSPESSGCCCCAMNSRNDCEAVGSRDGLLRSRLPLARGPQRTRRHKTETTCGLRNKTNHTLPVTTTATERGGGLARDSAGEEEEDRRVESCARSRAQQVLGCGRGGRGFAGVGGNGKWHLPERRVRARSTFRPPSSRHSTIATTTDRALERSRRRTPDGSPSPPGRRGVVHAQDAHVHTSVSSGGVSRSLPTVRTCCGARRPAGPSPSPSHVDGPASRRLRRAHTRVQGEGEGRGAQRRNASRACLERARL